MGVIGVLSVVWLSPGDWTESSFLMYFDLEREPFNRLFFTLMDSSKEVGYTAGHYSTQHTRGTRKGGPPAFEVFDGWPWCGVV
jgi:hypothetical protein